MKRVHSILKVLFAFIMLASSATSAWADEFKKGPLTFKFTPGETTCSVIKCDTLASGKVTVPKKIKCDGKTYQVTSIGEGAFASCSSLISVKLPKGLTSIGERAFLGCTSLTSIPFPHSLTNIGDMAFSNCLSLTSTILLNNDSDIALYGHPSLISVTISKNVTNIEYPWTFHFQSTLKDIIVDKKNPNYSSENGLLFNKDKTELIAVPGGLTSIRIPKNTTKIDHLDIVIHARQVEEFIVDEGNTSYSSENGLLLNKDKTKLIAIPQGLTYVKIPKNTTKIYPLDITTHAKQVKEITVDEENPSYSSEGGMLFNKDKTELIIVPSSATSVIIPASTKRLSMLHHPFEACHQLKEILVDANNTTFSAENGMLFNKYKTVLVSVPCTYTSVNIPKSVKVIGWGAFQGCTSLSSITLPDSLTRISSFAFDGCDSLNSITIPQSVKNINDCAFSYNSLTEILVDADNQFYSSEGGILYNKDKTKLITVPGKLSSITIPNSVTSIGRSAFGDSLMTILVDENNTTYSSVEGALFNKEKTILITVPDKLEAVTIPEGVETIEKGAIPFLFKGTITFEGKMPPAKPENVFEYSGFARIIVPVGCAEAYKKAYPKVADKIVEAQ